MIVFINGLYQSAGVFLPLIRSMVGSESDFSDKFLLDSCCLWIPGYDKKDREFDRKYIEDEVFEFMIQKKQAQLEIADRLVVSNNRLSIDIFKNSELNFIGCDVGASVCIEFAAQNPEMVASVVMIDCGSSFASLKAKWLVLKTNRLLNQSPNIITNKFEQEQNIYKKIFLSTLMNYPAAKGVKSYFNIFKSYDFESTYNKIALDQQNQFGKIKILNLVDKKTGLSNNSSTKKLQKILEKNIITKPKSTAAIDLKSKQSLQIKTVAIGNKSILSSGVAQEISEKLRNFYA
jgi:hypothetical protein